MKKYFISILFLSTISFAEIISPEDNVTLNYRHVLFQWEQVPNATNYVITIYNESTGEYAIDTVESLIYINDTFLDWDLSYTWYVTPMFSDGSLGASIEGSNGSSYLTFNSLSSKPDNIIAPFCSVKHGNPPVLRRLKKAISNNYP